MTETLVHVQITVQPSVTGCTEAPERAGRILTYTIHTDLIFCFALIDIIFAPFTLIASRTLADIILPLQITGPIVETRRGSTQIITVHIVRTSTFAGDASVRLLTIYRCTDRIQLAAGSLESWRANTCCAVDYTATSIMAVALIRIR